MDSKSKETNRKAKGTSPVSDVKLRELAGRLGKEWEKLAIYLGFRPNEIERLKRDHQWEEDRIFHLLIEWRQLQPRGKDNISTLSKVLKKAGRNDLASDLGNPDFDVEACREELITFYKTRMGFIQLLPWGDDTEDMDVMFVNLELSQERTRRKSKMSGRTLCENDELFTLETWEGKRVNRILISGGPGSGKSTLLAKIAYDWAQQKQGTPLSRFTLLFLLSFREIPEDTNTLTGAIFDQLLPLHSKISKEDLEVYIRSNQASCLILADGFDERPSGVIGKHPQGEVENILAYRDYRECFLVISSRPHKIYNLGSYSKIYTQVALTGFSKENVNVYIHKFFSDDSQCAEGLISQICKSANLQKLSKIPVMLLLLCLIWSEDENLPDVQTKLYKQAVFYMWKRYHFKKYDSQFDSDDELQEGLDGFLVELGRSVFKEALDMKDEQILFSKSDFDHNVYELACAVGMLTREKLSSKLQGSSHVTFVHKSFQEFSSACFIVHMANTNSTGFHQFLEKIRGRDEVSVIFEILGFACGLNVDVAEAILRHLVGVFHDLSPDVAYITHGKYGIWPLFVFAQESGISYDISYGIFKSLFTSSILLSPESLSEHEWAAFAIFLQSASESTQQSVLHNISILECGDFLTSDSVRLLSMVLTKMVPKLRSLTLRDSSNCSSEESKRNRLAEAIATLPLLSDLTIDLQSDARSGVSGNRFSFDLTTFLSKIGSKQVSCLGLHDSKNQRMSFVVEDLADYLSSQRSLSSFTVTHLDLGPQKVSCLLRALESHLNMKSLCLTGLVVQEAVADVESIISRLENLKLCNCRMGDEHMTHFSQYAINASKLKILDLSHNSLGDCQSFGIQLKYCQAMQELILSFAGITSNGIELVSQSLSNMPHLAKLDVRHNKFGLKGLQALLMGLHSSASLRMLSCGPCSVPKDESCTPAMSACLSVAGINFPVVRKFHKVLLLEVDDQETISRMLFRSWDSQESQPRVSSSDQDQVNVFEKEDCASKSIESETYEDQSNRQNRIDNMDITEGLDTSGHNERCGSCLRCKCTLV